MPPMAAPEFQAPGVGQAWQGAKEKWKETKGSFITTSCLGFFGGVPPLRYLSGLSKRGLRRVHPATLDIPGSTNSLKSCVREKPFAEVLNSRDFSLEQLEPHQNK